MKLTEVRPGAQLTIAHYDEQQVTIKSAEDNQTTQYTTSFLLTAEQVIEAPPISCPKQLTIEQVQYFSSFSLELLLIASRDQQRCDDEALIQLAQQGIGVEFMTIGPACRTYNLLTFEARKVGLWVSMSTQ